MRSELVDISVLVILYDPRIFFGKISYLHSKECTAPMPDLRFI